MRSNVSVMGICTTGRRAGGNSKTGAFVRGRARRVSIGGARGERPHRHTHTVLRSRSCSRLCSPPTGRHRPPWTEASLCALSPPLPSLSPFQALFRRSLPPILHHYPRVRGDAPFRVLFRFVVLYAGMRGGSLRLRAGHFFA